MTNTKPWRKPRSKLEMLCGMPKGLHSYNGKHMNRMFCVLCSIVMVAASPFSWAQTQSSKEEVPVIKGDVGPCSLALTVIGGDGKPAYAAKVKVHIAYGFGRFHRLDLEAGTNSDGKVTFAGLPQRVSRPPLEFHASKDEWLGIATYDPSVECEGKRDITLEKQKAPDTR